MSQLKGIKNSTYIIINLILVLLIIQTSIVYSQANDDNLIQFSGIVVSADSIKPIAFSTVLIKNTNSGTVTDIKGFFSFAAHRGDVIIFSSLGYKRSSFAIPDTLRENYYTIVKVMHIDTIKLKEVVIYPYPTLEQFKEAFVRLKIPDDDLERAKKNLALAELKEHIDEIKMDGEYNYNMILQQKINQSATRGQYPFSNLLNPWAWSRFIDDLVNGRLKIEQ